MGSGVKGREGKKEREEKYDWFTHLVLRGGRVGERAIEGGPGEK